MRGEPTPNAASRSMEVLAPIDRGSGITLPGDLGHDEEVLQRAPVRLHGCAAPRSGRDRLRRLGPAQALPGPVGRQGRLPARVQSAAAPRRQRQDGRLGGGLPGGRAVWFGLGRRPVRSAGAGRRRKRPPPSLWKPPPSPGAQRGRGERRRRRRAEPLSIRRPQGHRRWIGFSPIPASRSTARQLCCSLSSLNETKTGTVVLQGWCRRSHALRRRKPERGNVTPGTTARVQAEPRCGAAGGSE